MKLLSVLALCAALSIAVTHASSLARDEEEIDQASVQEILDILAEAEAEADDTDEEAIAQILAKTGKLSEKQKAKVEGLVTSLVGGYLLRRIRIRRRW